MEIRKFYFSDEQMSYYF